MSSSFLINVFNHRAIMAGYSKNYYSSFRFPHKRQNNNIQTTIQHAQ